MSRRPALTTQAHIARAIRAAQQCGAPVVEIKPDGTIQVKLSPESNTVAQEPTIEPLAKVVL
jgi:hypothetical protein